MAEVVTDDGKRVEVRGTEDTSWLADSYSSVDRRYAVGGRYEFHPVNDESPYEDNACTATRQLSGPPLPASDAPNRDGALPQWLPVDEQAGPIGYIILLGPLAVAGLVLATVVRRRLARRRAPL